MSQFLVGIAHAVFLVLLGAVILFSWISFVRKIIMERRSHPVEGTSSVMGYPPSDDPYMPYVPYALDEFLSSFQDLDF